MNEVDINDKFPQEQRHGIQSINKNGIPVLPNDKPRKAKPVRGQSKFERMIQRMLERDAKAGK